MSFEHLDQRMKSLIENGDFTSAAILEEELIGLPMQRMQNKEAQRYCLSCEAILATAASMLGRIAVSEDLKATYLAQKKLERAGCIECKTS